MTQKSLETKPLHKLADATITFLDALAEALRRAGAYNKNDQAPPAVVLWPDGERQWEPLLPTLRERLPILTFGPYVPGQRTGPAYWIRAMLARALEDRLPLEPVPIVYLAGVGKSELRAIEECPRPLQPLAELQFRGVVWVHRNGRDWTVAGFLQSTDGGLGVEVAPEAATRQALARALTTVASLPVAALRKEAPLRAAFFDSLLNPDDVRSLLLWLDDSAAYQKQCGLEAWDAFCNLCVRKYGLHPQTDGALTAAQALAARKGNWKPVWERYEDAPHLYPRISDLLRQARPAQLSLLEPNPVWPQDNESAEARLREGLQALSKQSPEMAWQAIAQLEQEHSRRRGWVWAKLGKAPLATALQHLSTLAQGTQQSLGGADTASITATYTDGGWRVDAAVLDATAAVERADDVAAIRNAIEILYRPWLENAARALQARVAAGDYLAAALPKPGAGTCLLFCDALRMDVGQRLAESLRADGLDCSLRAHLAALPPVTATAKVAISPVAGLFSGTGMPNLEPGLQANGTRASAEVLRRALTGAGFQVLKDGEVGDPSGRAWTELGAFDAYGHQHGWKIALHTRAELRALQDRVAALINAGWKQVVVMTDHGWLLLPGGLPKAELPEHLTIIRKGRCARLKDGARTNYATVPWHWDRTVPIAIAPGVFCYEAGKEYEHGGISPQECVVPVLTVNQPAGAGRRTVTIESVSWKGLRCVVTLRGAGPDFRADIRRKAGDPAASVVTALKSPDDAGSVSLVVENDDLIGEAAILVVLTETGQLCAQMSTIIGG